MRIVVDAMGSDDRPIPDVAGAVAAAQEYSDEIILVGDESRVKAELDKHPTSGLRIEVVHAADEITMTDKPGIVVKNKPESSMHVGMRLLKDGQGDAFVTAGNTGAVLAVATLKVLRRIPGVDRPALTAIFRVVDQEVMLLDAGANAEGKPEWLAQYAIMGKIYAHDALQLESPRIGLLSNGEEDEKGNQLLAETRELLRDLPINYIGNVEPKEVVAGAADVIIADGFTGNIFLKSLEAGSSGLVSILRTEIRSTVLGTLGGLLLRPTFGHIRQRIDPAEIGGAPLLGVNGVVIIGHGSSNALAIKNAVRQARQAVAGEIVTAIQDGVTLAPDPQTVNN